MLVIDFQGLVMTKSEAEILAHPNVSGLILFARNCHDKNQIAALTASARAIKPNLVIMVDQEGGRVQRLKQGFTQIPPMSTLGRCYDGNPELAINAARVIGRVIAKEVAEVGIDLPLAPVVDIGGCSRVIGDRALHSDPDIVVKLAIAFHKGMAEEGVASCAKHFPGHGGIEEDTHTEIALDDRSYETLLFRDLIPFRSLISSGLSALMPAHVIFPVIDEHPVGFSSFWLQEILRHQLGYQGAIISDDLGMAAAAVAGDLMARSVAAVEAGCDLLLLCNQPEEARYVVENIHLPDDPIIKLRIDALRAIPCKYDVIKGADNYIKQLSSLE